MITIEGRLPEASQTTQVVVENGLVTKVEANQDRFGRPDIANCRILPPLMDPQVNGGLGISFTSPQNPENYHLVLQECWRRGISHILPTIITTDPANLQNCLRAIRAWRESDWRVARAIPGIHLEGPGISSSEGFRGAHPRDSVRPWAEVEYRTCQDTARGLIKKVTLAPESLEDLGVVRAMVGDGVLVSMGHTNASADQIMRALDAGVTLFTHWGNGISRTIDRHLNPLWPALAEDRLSLSIIADGQHLPPAMLKTAYRCKGAEKLVLTADTSPLAGMPAGTYDLWGSKIVVDGDQRLTVEGTGYLAGSGVWMDRCFQNIFQLSGGALDACTQMASSNIRRLLGMPRWDLIAGKPAEMTLVSQADDGLILGCFASGQFSPYLGKKVF